MLAGLGYAVVAGRYDGHLLAGGKDLPVHDDVSLRGVDDGESRAGEGRSALGLGTFELGIDFLYTDAAPDDLFGNHGGAGLLGVGRRRADEQRPEGARKAREESGCRDLRVIRYEGRRARFARRSQGRPFVAHVLRCVPDGDYDVGHLDFHSPRLWGDEVPGWSLGLFDAVGPTGESRCGCGGEAGRIRY